MRLFISIALLLSFCVTVHAQVVPRVSGLEKDTIYMSLLAQENQLQIKEDSVSLLVDKTRTMFRAKPDERANFSTILLKLEGELFDIRNEIGVIESKINDIEQEFVINNLGKPSKPSLGSRGVSTKTDTTPQIEYPDLVSNDYFKKNLSEKDYNALVNSQRKEKSIVNYLKIYATNYATLQHLDLDYQKAIKAHTADSIYTKYKLISALNNKIADSVASIWSYINDNKTYAYSYLFDKMNQIEALSRYEKMAAQVRQQRAEIDGRYASDAVGIYPDAKGMLLKYEMMMAETLELNKSLDSLRSVSKAIDTLNLLLPKVIIAERNFIDYQDITIAARTPYSTSNPIPKCAIYANGTVYRILLGSYTKAQAPSIFRGVSPIGYIYANKRHNYYAGGYTTLQEAEAAINQLKAAWFKHPEIVVWEDGVLRNCSQENVSGDSDKSDANALYRIQISNVKEDLPTEVKQIITEQGAGVEISRIANTSTADQYTFIIGTFTSKAAANKLLQAILQFNDTLAAKITSIEN